jgi:hypothetical protein
MWLSLSGTRSVLWEDWLVEALANLELGGQTIEAIGRGRLAPDVSAWRRGDGE